MARAHALHLTGSYRFGLGRRVDELLAEGLPVLIIGSLFNDNLLVVVG
jgi:hypothetical protein